MSDSNMQALDSRPLEIWLADLAHDSNTFKTIPLGIGCIAACTKKELGDAVEFRFFKRVAAFSDACRDGIPDVIGLTNGIWNHHLSYTLVQKIKAIYPEVIIVFGGPNYPIDPEDQKKFLESHPLVDFCFFRDAEETFPPFIRTLIEYKCDVTELKQSGIELDGCHYLNNGEFISGKTLPRIDDLTRIPSPYLMGFYDDFLQDYLDPLLQPTRGCPFTCTYCTEGQPYHATIARLELSRFEEELEYIAQRIKHKELTLHIGDANFGMFPRDVEICEIIARVQDKYDWPRRVDASLGKNNIDNILEGISRLKYGTLWYSAAIQSTDPTVLENIRRKNISSELLLEAAQRSAKYQRGSNSEVILNLPGDTVEGHLYTLRTVMDAGISRIRLYPLVLLPGTEAESPADRKKFQIKSRFRIFPRTYGMYEFGGEEFSSAEVSELVIETSSMTFDDYVYCRLFDLSVELFYNDGYFLEIQGLLSFLKISMFEFVKVCHDLMSEYPADLKRIYEGLADSILKYTWETEEEIHDFINDIASIQKYAEIEHENSLATDRAIGVFSCAETLHVIARRALKNLLQMQEINDKELLQYVDEMLMFSLSRKDSLLDTSIVKLEKFNYDFPALHKEKFSIDPLSHKLAKPQQLCFRHKSDIAKEMTRLYRAKKDPIHGMRNILYYSIAANPADYYYRSFQEVSE